MSHDHSVPPPHVIIHTIYYFPNLLYDYSAVHLLKYYKFVICTFISYSTPLQLRNIVLYTLQL